MGRNREQIRAAFAAKDWDGLMRAVERGEQIHRREQVAGIKMSLESWPRFFAVVSARAATSAADLYVIFVVPGHDGLTATGVHDPWRWRRHPAGSGFIHEYPSSVSKIIVLKTTSLERHALDEWMQKVFNVSAETDELRSRLETGLISREEFALAKERQRQRALEALNSLVDKY